MKTDQHGCVQISGTTGNPVLIQDVSLRDGHVSLFAIEERTKNVLKHISLLDTLGLHSIQVLTGLTPASIQKHMDAAPWKKISAMKKHAPNTLLSMAVTAAPPEDSNDKLLLSFIEKAVESGIEIVRVVNPYNEFDRFKEAGTLVKKHKAHFQAAVCYNLSDKSRSADKAYLDYYVNACKTLADMGADSVCIQDMAGIMSPYEAYNLVKALKAAVKLPVHLYTQCASGMAGSAVLKAVEAGVDMVDTCMAPLALRSSLPALEPLAFALSGTSRDTGVDKLALIKFSREMEQYTAAYKHLVDTSKTSLISLEVYESLLDDTISNKSAMTAEALSLKGSAREGVAELPQTADSYNVFVDGEYFDVKISKGSGPRKSRIRKKDNTETIIRERTLTSPLPGLIIDIKKKVGDQVKIGEPVAVLEAMKMLNRLEAKYTGVIKEIRVKEGDMVEKGDVICVIE